MSAEMITAYSFFNQHLQREQTQRNCCSVTRFSYHRGCEIIVSVLDLMYLSCYTVKKENVPLVQYNL